MVVCAAFFKSVCKICLIFLCFVLIGCNPEAATQSAAVASATPEQAAAFTPQPAQATPTKPPPTATATLAPTPTQTPIPPPQVIDTTNILNLKVTEKITLGSKGVVSDVHWAKDESTILVQTESRLDVYNAETLEKTGEIENAHFAHWLNDGRFFSDSAGNPAFMDPLSGKTEGLNRMLPDANEKVFDASSDGGLIAYLVNEKDIYVYNLSTKEKKQYTFTLDSIGQYQVDEITFSPDGTLLLVNITHFGSGQIGKIIGLDLASGAKVYQTSGENKPVFSPDGKRMLVTQKYLPVILVVSNGQPWSRLTRFFGSSTNDGGEMAYILTDAKWRPNDEKEYIVGQLYAGSYMHYKKSEVSFKEGQLQVIDTAKNNIVQTVYKLPQLVQTFDFNPDGSKIVLVTQTGAVSIVEIPSGNVLQEKTLYDLSTPIIFSPDGKYTAQSHYSFVRVIEQATNTSQDIYPKFGANELDMVFIDSQNLALFYRSTMDPYVEFWDLQSGENTYVAPYIQPNCTFEVDGQIMVCSDQTLRFFNVASGEWLMDIQTLFGSGFSYAISSDLKLVAYCTFDSPNIFLYSLQGGRLEKQFTADTPDVCGSLAFSPDNASLISVRGLVWDVATKEVKQKFAGITETAPIVFSPKRDLFLAGNTAFQTADYSKLGEVPFNSTNIHFSEDGLFILENGLGEFQVWATQ